MRKILGILFTLVILLVGAAVVVPFLIPVETYKKEITTRLSAMTGREIRIDGDMRFKLLPNVAIVLEQVRVGNPPGYKSEYLTAIEVLDVEVALKPLFNKQVEITRLVLKKPIVHLEINKAGTPNWDITFTPSPIGGGLGWGPGEALSRPDNAPHLTSPLRGEGLDNGWSLIAQAHAQENAPAGGFTLKAATLKGLAIEDGTLSYRDARTNTSHQLQQVHLTADSVAYEQPLSVKGSTVWNGEKVAVDAALGSVKNIMDAKSTKVNTRLESKHFKLSFQGAASPSSANGQVEAGTPSAVAMMRWLGKPMAWNKTQLTSAVRGPVTCTTSQCAMKDADLAIDAVRLKGDATYGWGGDKPSIKGNFTAGALDLNPYVAQAAAEEFYFFIRTAMAQSRRSFSEDGWSTEPIDLNGLNAINADIALAAESIAVRQFTLGKPALKAVVTNGALALHIDKTALFGGNVNGVVNTAPTGGGNRIGANLHASGVDIKALLMSLGDDDRLSGTGELQLQLSGQGRNQAEIISRLGGNGNVMLRNGAIKGVNLAQMARNIKSAFTGDGGGAQQTDFTELGGTFTATGGVISNSDLAMKSPYLRMTGQGNINLPQYTISYRLMPEVVNTSKGQGGKELEGLGVPIIVSGALNNPQFTPDVGSVVKDVLENPEKYKENIEAVKEQIKEGKGDISGVKEDFKQLKEGLKDPENVKKLLEGLGGR